MERRSRTGVLEKRTQSEGWTAVPSTFFQRVNVPPREDGFCNGSVRDLHGAQAGL